MEENRKNSAAQKALQGGDTALWKIHNLTETA